MSLEEVNLAINDSCQKSGRDISDVKLIAVSKLHSVNEIEKVISTGHKVFGENRVQEALEKFIPLKEKYKDLELHLIGSLQTNKVKEAVTVFDVIHTIDRIKLADALKTEMDKQNKNLPCFIQVNTGDEEQKGGVSLGELDALLKHCRDNLKLNIKGLMCIPPANETPDMHFALMNKLAKEHSLECLSMGMSSDFETAIKYGATDIRIGSAIFGERKTAA